MTHKLTTLLAATAILASVGTATAVLAEETAPGSQLPRQGTGMMGDEGGMMGMMGQMSPDHMKQMTRMINNCNRMMESTTTTTTPGAEATGAKG
jgi:hypothetical protein